MELAFAGFSQRQSENWQALSAVLYTDVGSMSLAVPPVMFAVPATSDSQAVSLWRIEGGRARLKYTNRSM